MPDQADVTYLPAVAVTDLHENTWNPNVMDEAQRIAVRESIEAFGFVDPVTVRPHPTLEGYEIIDGEHRVAQARRLGHTELPVVVLDVDTVTAQRLTAIFVETRGDPDPGKMGALASELHEMLGPEALTGLPWSDRDMARMLRLAETSGAPREPRAGDWFKVVALVPEEVRPAWDAAIARAKDAGWEPPEDDQLAAGQFMELLVADYMAG